MATMITTTIEKVIKLLPSVRRQLIIELRAAQQEKIALAKAEKAWDDRKAKIRKIREETGEESLEIDGHSITNVQGVTTRFDEKKMLGAGLSFAQIESFKVTTPKKAYEKITFPSDKVAKRLLENRHGD